MAGKDEKTLHLTIDRERHEQLERIADRKGIKQVSVLARMLIYDALEEESGRP